MAISLYNRSGTLVGQSAQMDNVPLSGSDNTVKSGGVYDATESIKCTTSAVTNLIDKSRVVEGTINTTTGKIEPDSANRYHVTDFIEVDTSEIYLSPKCDKMGAYGENKQFISVVNVSPDALYSSGEAKFPDGTKYVRLRIIQNGVNDAIFVQAKYYRNNSAVSTIYTGFSDNFAEAFKDGLAENEENDSMHYVPGKNMFDYERDYFQVQHGPTNGINRQTGEYIYRYNLIENESEIDGAFSVAMDKYYPVEYGQIIVSNMSFSIVAFYDEDKVFIEAKDFGGANRPYYGFAAPEESAFARVSFNGNPSNTAGIKSLADIKNIVVWTIPVVGDNDLAPDVLSPQPRTLIDGRAISPNYLDKVVPNMSESNFLSAMRCMAIREINNRDHAWRFGNFNMWIMQGTKGWSMTKKMLMDYGVDFCGFEECTTNVSTALHKGIAEFLHGWQFPSGFYANWTDGESQIDKSFVSRFNVIESTKLIFASASSNATYLNCKVQMPRYMDVYEPFRILSCYIVHFPIVQSADKIAIATELLQQISTDDSDFIVILGDTNDFGATPETKDYWVTLENGGFKPVLPYNIKTAAQDNGEGGTEEEPDRWWKLRAIDQFFISDNITAINYGIKNTKEDYAIADSYTSVNTDGEPVLSDHDFVYCDLKFDYSKPRTIIPVE